MDWDKVNVGLDQEAFKAAQAAGETGFSIPWWAILLFMIVGGVFAVTVVKKSKEGGDSAEGGAGRDDK